MSAAPTLSAHQFQILKTLANITAFVLVACLQWLRPYRFRLGNIASNWATNLPLGTVNAGLLSFLCGGCVCTLSARLASLNLGLMNRLSIPMGANIVITVLTFDLIAYFWHRMNHRVALLWRFHAVHHCDRVFETSTAFRFHIGELLMSLGIRLLAVFLLGPCVMGILVFEVVYGFFNLFDHGGCELPGAMESALGRVFISPALHRLHHSQNPADLNSNFGTIFSFWDRLLETKQESSSSKEIQVGLEYHSTSVRFLQLMRLPFTSRSPNPHPPQSLGW